MRPSRYLMVLTTIFVVLYAVLLFTGVGSTAKKMKPNLGLDLSGGTSLTLVAQTVNGPPTADAMQQARDIIQSRVDGFGVERGVQRRVDDRFVVGRVPV